MAKTQENKGAQELNEALNKSEAFIRKYKKALIAAIIGIIVIIAGIIYPLILFQKYLAAIHIKTSLSIRLIHSFYLICRIQIYTRHFQIFIFN